MGKHHLPARRRGAPHRTRYQSGPSHPLKRLKRRMRIRSRVDRFLVSNKVSSLTSRHRIRRISCVWALTRQRRAFLSRVLYLVIWHVWSVFVEIFAKRWRANIFKCADTVQCHDDLFHICCVKSSNEASQSDHAALVNQNRLSFGKVSLPNYPVPPMQPSQPTNTTVATDVGHLRNRRTYATFATDKSTLRNRVSDCQIMFG